MSGKAYGTIQVRQEADVDDSDLPPTTTAHATERIPLLSAVSSEEKKPPPSSPLSTKSSDKAVQTDPTKLTKALRYLEKIWSDTTFDWISPLLETGNANGQLNVEDLDDLPLPDDCETSQVYARFWRYWNAELERARADSSNSNNSTGDINDETFRLLVQHTTSSTYQPSLTKALARAFGADFLRAGLLKLIHDSNLFVGPQVLNHLIQFLRNADAPLHRGVMLTVLVVVSQIVMSISLRHYFYKCYTCGLQVRTAVVLAVYKKSLQLSLKERHTFGNGGGPGEIVNLVGIDAQRMQDLMTYLHAVWYSFYQIGLAMYFLWGQVGASCLAGVAVIVVLIPVTKFVAGYLSGIQKILVKARDARVSLNNELMNAMKVSCGCCLPIIYHCNNCLLKCDSNLCSY